MMTRNKASQNSGLGDGSPLPPGYVLLATTNPGIARITQTDGGEWSVDTLLRADDVRCFATDPLNPGVVYAGTNNRGLLRSADSGATWSPSGLEGVPIRSVTASAARDGMLCVGAKPPALYLSCDSGASWQDLPAFRKRRQWWWFTPAEPGAEYVQAVGLSPTNPDVILAGIEFGAVLRSEDGGASWSIHRKGALRDCHSMTFHAVDGRWAYEGGGTGAGAAVSHDGGQTWTQPRQGLDAHYGWATAADPAHPEIWYVATAPGPMKAHGRGHADAGIYRTAAGTVWDKIAGPLHSMPYALLTEPSLPGTLVAGLADGTIMVSPDHGDTWSTLPARAPRVDRAMAIVRIP